MPEYVCTRPCWHGKHLYRLGERVDCESSELSHGKDGSLIHFEPVEVKRGRGRPRQEESQESPGGVEVKVNEKTIKK